MTTTAAEKILAKFGDRATSFTTKEALEKIEAGQGAVWNALSDLVATGKLVRISTGVYAMPGSDAASGAPAAPRARESTPPQTDQPPAPRRQGRVGRDRTERPARALKPR
jgi:hypothetical protein